MMGNEIVPAGPIVVPSSEAPIVPSGEIRPPTWGQTAEDVAKSFGSGLVKGTTALVDLPGDIMSLGIRGVEKLTGYDIPQGIERGMLSAIPGMGPTGESHTERARKSFPSVMEYKAQTVPGRYAGTVGEFVPGAAATALTGGSSMVPTILRGAVAPGIASELAGQSAQKYLPNSEWAEPAARLAGAILGGGLASIGEGAAKTAISPGGGASPIDLKNAEILRREGINVTSGQATGSPIVRAIEANNPELQAITQASKNSPQLMEFTRASLSAAGLTDDVIQDVINEAKKLGVPVNPTLANTVTMDVLEKTLGRRFEEALNGVQVPPTSKIYDTINQVVDDLNPRGFTVSGSSRPIPTPIIRLASEMDEAVMSGSMIKASRLQDLRSQLGSYLSSTDPEVARAAASVRDALDEAIFRSVSSMGEPDRMRSLLDVRRQYQNYLAIENAIKPRQGMSSVGIITPQDLASSVASQGKRAFLTGRRDVGKLSTAAIDRLGPLPPSTRRPGRSTMAALAEGAGSLAAYPSILMAGTAVPALSGAITAAAAPVAVGMGIDAARRLAMRQVEKYAHTPVMQAYLRNQLVNPNVVPGSVAPGIAGVTTSQLSSDDRQGRKSGGRVSSHEEAADQLVRAAERAKKGQSAQTQVLLNQSDDAVASALEIANRSI